FGRAGPLSTGARGVSARAVGQLYAVHDTHRADAPSAGRITAEDLGDDAWVCLCRRWRPGASRPCCNIQGCLGAEIARESEGSTSHSRLVWAQPDEVDISLEFFPSAQAAAEHEYACAGGDEDESIFVVQPRDVLVDAECL